LTPLAAARTHTHKLIRCLSLANYANEAFNSESHLGADFFVGGLSLAPFVLIGGSLVKCMQKMIITSIQKASEHPRLNVISAANELLYTGHKKITTRRGARARARSCAPKKPFIKPNLIMCPAIMKAFRSSRSLILWCAANFKERLERIHPKGAGEGVVSHSKLRK
jgi:hypothetical protein